VTKSLKSLIENLKFNGYDHPNLPAQPPPKIPREKLQMLELLGASYYIYWLKWYLR
jgi:hypothetical protein